MLPIVIYLLAVSVSGNLLRNPSPEGCGWFRHFVTSHLTRTVMFCWHSLWQRKEVRIGHAIITSMVADEPIPRSNLIFRRLLLPPRQKHSRCKTHRKNYSPHWSKLTTLPHISKLTSSWFPVPTSTLLFSPFLCLQLSLNTLVGNYADQVVVPKTRKHIFLTSVLLSENPLGLSPTGIFSVLSFCLPQAG